MSSTSAPLPHWVGPVESRPSLALQPGRGGLTDELLAISAFIVLPLTLPMAEPLRLPLALLLMGYAALYWRALLPTMISGAVAFALPALCLVSMIWAADKVGAVWHGALMMIGMVTAALIATRLDLRQIILALFLSQAILAVASVATMTTAWIGGDIGGHWALVGVFPHKNILGARSLWLLVAALAVLFTPGFRPFWRLVALAMLPVALLLLTRSLAASAQILALGAIPLALLLFVVWGPASRVQGARSLIILSGLAAVPLVLIVLLNVFGIHPVDDLLGVFGKERTLTGRTDIWAHGQAAFAERPLLGVGVGNYWQADNPAAVRLSARFYAVELGRFEFHSLLFEILVHLGIVGLAVAVWSYGTGVKAIFRQWLGQQDALTGFSMVILALIAIRALTESILFSPLNLDPLLFWTLAFSAMAAHGAKSQA